MLGLPMLGVVGFGCPVGVGWVGPSLWCQPCWPPGSCTGFRSREKRDLCGPQAHGGTKISGDRPRGLSA